MNYEFYSIINSYKIENNYCENLINEISFINNEPKWLNSFRLNCFYLIRKFKKPKWYNFYLKNYILKKSCYYSFHDNKNNYSLKKTYKKFSKKNIALDFVLNSISIKTTMKNKLEKKGIIFTSINNAIRNFKKIFKKYFSTIIRPNDNFFSCLNSSIFSDGTFIYVPSNTICPVELSTYFRINDNTGQFERTLIICEKNSKISYLEGCTAARVKTNELHSAVVELISKKNSLIKYSTIQNWYSSYSFLNGINNFVTKRGLCLEESSNINWIQIEIGSSITWKYPSCILKGNYSKSDFYSISISNNYQQIDTGTKMIYYGNKCYSTIISKSIALGNSFQTYRGIVKINKNSNFSKNYTSCDSIITNNSKVFTFPINIIKNNNCVIEHEASITKISYLEIFYLKSKGLLTQDCYSLLINNFCYSVFKKLPFEFFYEINELINSIINYSII